VSLIRRFFRKSQNDILFGTCRRMRGRSRSRSTEKQVHGEDPDGSNHISRRVFRLRGGGGGGGGGRVAAHHQDGSNAPKSMPGRRSGPSLISLLVIPFPPFFTLPIYGTDAAMHIKFARTLNAHSTHIQTSHCPCRGLDHRSLTSSLRQAELYSERIEYEQVCMLVS